MTYIDPREIIAEVEQGTGHTHTHDGALALADAILRALHEHEYVIRYDWDAIGRRQAAERKAERATRVATAIDYHGAIATCQAAVPVGGRAIGYRRCVRKPTKVIRAAGTFGDTYGDGRLAVCAIHARQENVTRYTVNPQDWTYKVAGPGAIEPVEQEYQP
jgi:ADP-ribosylglycohydrolase